MKVSSTAIKKIIPHRLFPVFLACLLAFSLRLYRLEHPQKLYFDEVYHGFTALEYARNNAAAYDPWATPPKGFAYEWTHPPLAKMIMAGSVAVLGPNSLAWRLPPAIFGSLSILLAALIADELFRSSKIAILTAYFLTLDGLNFVMSRLAMNDTTFICFMLAAILAYLKSKKANSERQSYWLVVSGISLGLALASKWTTLYVFGLLGCDQLITWWHQKKLPSVQQFLLLCLTLGGIPILVYLLSYLHYFALGYTWENFVELQKQMWWYHTKLSATHGYQSRPWQWVLNVRPVWFYSGSSFTTAENIYALGNPVFFWTGLVAVLATIWELIKTKFQNAQALVFVLLAYFFMWAPWILSPRIMFFYHYLPATLFLSIILARLVAKYGWTGRYPSKYVWAVLAATALWFFVFYPHLSGAPIDKTFADSVYYLIPGWR